MVIIRKREVTEELLAKLRKYLWNSRHLFIRKKKGWVPPTVEPDANTPYAINTLDIP